MERKLFPLVVSILLLEIFNTFGLGDFEQLEFLTIVHGLINTLVDGDQLFVILHDLQLGCGLDLGGLNSTIELAVECFHLLLVLHLEVLNLLKSFFLVGCEVLLPHVVEVLHVLLSNSDVLAHLSILNVCSEVVLEGANLGFEQSDFLHQVLVELVLMDLTALVGEQLHFLLDDGEDHDLLVFVED